MGERRFFGRIRKLTGVLGSAQTACRRDSLTRRKTERGTLFGPEFIVLPREMTPLGEVNKLESIASCPFSIPERDKKA